MKRTLLMLCIAIATLGTARTASAETQPHEVLLNGASVSIPAAGASVDFNPGLNFGVSAGYIYSFHPMIGFGIYPTFSFNKASSVAASTVAFNVVAGPTFNFPTHGDDIDTAFFLTGAAGISTSAGTTKFIVRAEVGKRFKLFEHVTWRPSFGVLVNGPNSPSLAMVFNLASMSLVF